MKMQNKLSLLCIIMTGAFFFGTPEGKRGFFEGMGIEAAASETSEEVLPEKARSRETYYPNNEDLLPDEMRVIAFGT